jgi:hypothetical protein
LPPLPHSVVFWPVVTHPLLSQQPLGHEVASQATHAPLAQTRLVPQVCPSLMFFGESHDGPLVHDIVPCWQGLPVGVQGAFGVQATQAPLPSQTPLGTELVWHDVPAFDDVF